ITFLTLVSLIEIYGQACGGKIISFKVFNEMNKESLNHEIYYVSRNKVDSVFKFKANTEDWIKNQNLGNGIIIDTNIGSDLIVNGLKSEFTPRSFNNNIIYVFTPELSTNLALIKINISKKNFYIITF